jgi:asparagine synthetase B (glutamine-hydrolysing)
VSDGWLLRCNVENATFSADGEPQGVSWNPAERRLELTRDPTGLRPLFYTRADGGDLVASPSLRSLLAEPGVTIAPSRETAAAWLTGAPIGPDETLLEGIKRVPAGHVLGLTPRGETRRRWWSPAVSGTLGVGEAIRFDELIEAAVARAVHARRSCVFLSGGIDSGTIAVAAGAVARQARTEAPLALCVIFPGASEESVQREVASAAGLDLLEARVELEGLAERALVRAARSLWPTSAAWAPIFDDLAAAAQSRGAEVLLDGQGGDELLDAGYEAGRVLAGVLARSPLALYDWARAERAYTGRLRSSVKILALDLLGRRDRNPPALPDWLADDLREPLQARFDARPRGYDAIREADVLDGVLAAQREETFDRGRMTGLEQRHPFWDPQVVSLLDGLPPAALVAGGDPKAPARHYLSQRVPTIAGRWPQPRAAALVSGQVAAQLQGLLSAQGGLPVFEEHGVVRPDAFESGVADTQIWRMMALDAWFQNVLGE